MSMIPGILLLAFGVVGVLVVGTLSANALYTHTSPQKEPQPEQKPTTEG